MPVNMICASHSPLMLTDIEPTDISKHEAFYAAVSEAKKGLEEFNPDVVLLFYPDHFNGFFYDLMPSFCIGTAAEGRNDWRLTPGRLNVPGDLASECVDALIDQDMDVAISHEMMVDHGATIPLKLLADHTDQYSVIPIFINCPAAPRPSFRRVRRFGDAIGRFFAGKNMRVAVVGSGGISHDPPTPRPTEENPEVPERLIERRIPGQEELDGREARVLKAAHEMVAGTGTCLPPNEDWDREFLEKVISFDTEALDAITDEEINRVAGLGGHEVRTWVAAVAASKALGMQNPHLDCYQMIPEWITGMGVVTGQG